MAQPGVTRAGPMNLSHETVCRDTRRWLERAVIGLNLCPFAKAVHVKGLVHYAVSDAHYADELLHDLERQLRELASSDPVERDTTLLIAPHCLSDFLDFNAFLRQADKAIERLRLDGVLQVASLHPDYQFADADADDITNFTNRSPYPTLHLLREASIDRAVAAFPDAAAIFETNKRTMERLGHDGWAALDVAASGDVSEADDR